MEESRHDHPSRVLVWQWGQRGAGPRFAAELAAALRGCGFDVVLSLSSRTEAYRGLKTLCPECLPFKGRIPGGAGWRVVLGMAGELRRLRRALSANPPRFAICAMVGYWDLPFALMLAAMGTKIVTVVHEIEGHLGDNHSRLYPLQLLMIRLSNSVITLSSHVTRSVRARWPSKPIVEGFHPPFAFEDIETPPARAHASADGPLRLLVAGRLRSYKGVARAISAFERLPVGQATLRVVGSGAVPALNHTVPGVVMKNTWLSERELIREIDSAHAVLFPYVEASQSGLVPLCLSRGRPAIVTAVGGLPDQVREGMDGLVVGAGVDKVAEAIGRLVQDELLLATLSARALADNDPATHWHRLGERITEALHAEA